MSSCSPSRASLLTGLPQHSNGMYGLHQGVHNFNAIDSLESISGVARKHNIRTGIIGKKHVGPEEVYPFDYAETEENNPINQVGRNITNIKILVRKFLQSFGNTSFFLLVSFHDPHRCGHITPEFGPFCEKWGLDGIPDWHPIKYEPEDIILPDFLPKTHSAREDVAAQYQTISRLDQGVGIVMKELKDYLDNTLIFYTSDNGIPFPRGRTNLYDSGSRVPLLISSPQSKKSWGKKSDDLISLLDIAPTIYDWFGIPPPVLHKKPHKNLSLPGKSLLPSLNNYKMKPYRDYVYLSHNLHEVTMYYPMRAIRSNKHKLIHNLASSLPFGVDQDLFVSPTWMDIMDRTKRKFKLDWFITLKQYYFRGEYELYDVEKDPLESNNLVHEPNYNIIFRKLGKKLNEWQNKTQDPWICFPHAVLEDKGYYKHSPECLNIHD